MFVDYTVVLICVYYLSWPFPVAILSSQVLRHLVMQPYTLYYNYSKCGYMGRA